MQISGPGQPAADFMIQGAQQHGISGLVNMFGIEVSMTCMQHVSHEVSLYELDGERLGGCKLLTVHAKSSNPIVPEPEACSQLEPK